MTQNGHRISQSGMKLAWVGNCPDKDLAINLGHVFGNLAGIPTKKPVFGMTAV